MAGALVRFTPQGTEFGVSRREQPVTVLTPVGSLMMPGRPHPTAVWQR